MQIGDRIARRMKLHDLRILMAVAQAGSMNKAAVFLNINSVRRFQIDRRTRTDSGRESA